MPPGDILLASVWHANGGPPCCCCFKTRKQHRSRHVQKSHVRHILLFKIILPIKQFRNDIYAYVCQIWINVTSPSSPRSNRYLHFERNPIAVCGRTKEEKLWPCWRSWQLLSTINAERVIDGREGGTFEPDPVQFRTRARREIRESPWEPKRVSMKPRRFSDRARIAPGQHPPGCWHAPKPVKTYRPVLELLNRTRNKLSQRLDYIWTIGIRYN